MFGVFRALCSIRSRAFARHFLAESNKTRSIEGFPDISNTTLFSYLLSAGSNRLDAFGRLCSSNAKDSRPKDKSENPSEEKKVENSSDQSASVDNSTKKQIEELTDILQGFSWKRSSTKNAKKSAESHDEDMPSMMQLLIEPSKFLERAYNWFYGRLIQNSLDVDFDIHDFLEGAKDAYYMVNQLFGEGDFETLKPMVSSKLLENFQAVSDDFKNKGMVMSISTEEIKGVNISGLRVVESDSLKQYGPEFESVPKTDGKTNFWFLIYVRFSSYHRFKVLKPEGTVVDDSLSYRRDLWTFVRGPVDVLPIKDPSPGWILLTIA